jgi:DNA recombination protein RmuC
MIVVIIIGSIVLVVLLITAAFYFLGQKFILQLTRVNIEQRKGNREEIETGVKDILNSHEKLLGEITRNLQKELKQSQAGVIDLKEQNAAIREQLTTTAKITEGLQVSTEGLRSLLANNRLRGEWGEQVAEDLLLAAGFVEKVNYLKQSTTAEGRPDFTILLPDGYKLNVDAKFPFDDLIVYQEAKTEIEKKRAIAAFSTSIKNKIKGITSKDYIDPEGQTLDFVMMFIPNEMIFSFVYEMLPDINEYASRQRVVLAGPFGFTAVLRMVMQAHKNFHHEKSLVQILGLISKFQEEYNKFGESMERLGKQIDTAQKTFMEVEGTRDRQLTRVVEQISHRSQNSLDSDKKSKSVRLELKD